MSVNLGTVYSALELDIKDFTSKMNEAKGQLTAFQTQSDLVSSGLTSVGSTITGIGTSLTASVTTPILGIGTAAVAATTSFDSSMSKVAALSGATGDDFDALREKALEMGSKTSFSASEAADALGYMALAGWDTNQMLGGLEGIMNLAAAGGSDLATTSDIVTDALTAFGYQASDSAHFADVLSVAMSKSNTTTEALGEAFKYVGPVAGALGYSVEDVSVALGLMANAGVKGSSAGTGLRQALNQLIKPTNAVATAMEKYDISLTNVDGTMKPLQQVMDELRDRLGDLSEAEQAEAASTLFGTRAMSGMLAIVNASDEDYEKLTSAINNADGAAQGMADTMLQNLGGQLTILKSQLEGIAIQIGDILMPYITAFVSKIQDLATWFSNLSEEQKKHIIAIAGVAAAIGPLLIVVGKLITGYGKFIALGTKVYSWLTQVSAAFGIAGGAGGAFTSILSGIATTVGPILAVAAAIAGITAALKAAYDQNGQFAESVDRLVSSLSDGLGGVIETIKTAFNNLKETLSEVIGTIMSQFNFEEVDAALAGFVDSIMALGDALKPVIDVVIKLAEVAIGSILAPAVLAVMGMISGVINAIGPLIETITSIVKVVTDVINVIVGLIEGLITGDFTKLKNAVKSLVSDLWSAITNFINTVVTFIQGFVTGVLATIDSFTGGLVTKVVGFFASLWSRIVQFFTVDIPTAFNTFVNETLPTFIQNAKTFFDQLPYNLGVALGNAIAAIQQWGTNVINWISTNVPIMINNIESWFKELPGKIQTWLTNTINKVISWGSEMKSKATETAQSFIDTMVNWFKELPGKIMNFIESIPGKISSARSSMRTAGTNIMNGLWDGLKAVWDNIKGWFEGIAKSVSNFVQGIKDGMSNAKNVSAGSHADGLAYVPYNGYKATLHEGERVLTKNEAEAYNRGSGTSYAFTFNSPKQIDPYEANRLFRQSVRELEEGFA